MSSDANNDLFAEMGQIEDLLGSVFRSLCSGFRKMASFGHSNMVAFRSAKECGLTKRSFAERKATMT